MEFEALHGEVGSRAACVNLGAFLLGAFIILPRSYALYVIIERVPKLMVQAKEESLDHCIVKLLDVYIKVEEIEV